MLGWAVGLFPPAAMTMMLVFNGVNGVVQWFVALITAFIEGAVLGFAQYWVMRPTKLRLPGKWVLNTAWGGLLAWGIATLPGNFFAPDWKNMWIASAMIAVFAFALVALPYMQWRVLREFVHDAWRWVLITAVSWIVGALIVLAITPLVQKNDDIRVLVVLYTLAVFLMVFVISLLTGLGMRWLLKEMYSSRRPAKKSKLASHPKVIAAKASAAAAAKKAGSKAGAAAKKAGSKAGAAAKSTAKKVTKKK